MDGKFISMNILTQNNWVYIHNHSNEILETHISKCLYYKTCITLERFQDIVCAHLDTFIMATIKWRYNEMLGGMTTMWGMFSFNLTNGSMCHWPKYVKGDDMKWQIGWPTKYSPCDVGDNIKMQIYRKLIGDSPSISPYIVGRQNKGANMTKRTM